MGGGGRAPPLKMVKILSQVIFFQTFLAKLFFSLKIQHQIIYLGKTMPPLLQVKWSVPNYNFEFVDTTERGAF